MEWVGGMGGGGGKREEMTQTLYALMNKIKNFKKVNMMSTTSWS
jgi:hypothetical protein